MVVKWNIDFLFLFERLSLDEFGMLKIDEFGWLKRFNKVIKKIENENFE